jgi:serine protease
MTLRNDGKSNPLHALIVAVALAVCAGNADAGVTTLRVMLGPGTTPDGVVPPALKAHLDALAGMPTTIAGFTRTGAVDLVLPSAVDAATAATMLRRLREDRAILWAQAPAAAGVAKSAQAAAASTATGYRFMLRLAPGVAADWATLLPQFAALVGQPLAVERNVAGIYVLSLLAAVPQATLATMASALENHPAVQYADAVRRVQAMTTPDDPLFARQWALTDPASGIDAPAAWNIETGLADLTIAVIDTGILPHPDLDAGRMLPGYDFISDPATARDGDGRDANPRDEGDWNDAGECDGAPASQSSWHGTFVTGLIGATADNGIGIAGVNWHSQLLPVRALGKCGGTTVDVLEAMMWASGVPIDGVPLNLTPARVINMSLGGAGSCDSAIQEAVDTAIAQGAVVVVAAGNQSDLAANYAPGNCGGVINVGAIGRGGDLASYSNFGSRVDLVAPGGDVDANDDTDGLMLSIWNDGTTVPGNPAYGLGAGTSFATPLVSGTVSLMLSRNANLTAGRVLSILTGTTRDFAGGTRCAGPAICGAGLLDAGLAVASTVPSSEAAPPGTLPVIEYYRADLDHYFITSSPDEIAYLDQYLGNVWQRTGGVFYAYPSGDVAPIAAQPVCRLFAGGLINSNFWSASFAQCAAVAADAQDGWHEETPSAFWIELPDANGNCPAGEVPVFRFFNNRRDANQRFTVDRSERRAMQNRAWVLDAPNATGAAFCSPI